MTVRFGGKSWHIGTYESNERAYLACNVACAVLEQHISEDTDKEKAVELAKTTASESVERSRRGNFNLQRGVTHLLSGKWVSNACCFCKQ